MVTGLAHVAVCVPDIDAAVAWYRDVLGLPVLPPPFRMEGDVIARDMGELLPEPVLTAAILGFEHGDHVLEVVEYPGNHSARPVGAVTDVGITHVGLVCD